MHLFFGFFSLGTPELIVMGIVGLLLFGRRLPEVGRSLGKSFVEFKAGLNEVKAELRDVDRLVEDQDAYEPVPRPTDSQPREADAKEVAGETKKDEAPSDDDAPAP